MTVAAVIGAAIIYYLKLEWWWWLILGIATIIDISQDVANNTNSANTVNRLSDIDYKIDEINEKINDRE
jgi:hypothetical protein